jgi:hypothetical protein
MADRKSCDFQSKNYADGGVVCVGDQCIQCDDGKWGSSKYELEAKQKILEAMPGS